MDTKPDQPLTPVTAAELERENPEAADAPPLTEAQDPVAGQQRVIEESLTNCRRADDRPAVSAGRE